MSHLARLGFLLEIVFLTACLGGNATAEPSWLKSAIDSSAKFQPDKDAAAIILAHTNQVQISRDGEAETHVRFAVKILKAAGVEIGMLQQPVLSWGEVNNLKGWLIQSDGTKRELTAKDVVRISASQAAGYYDDATILGAGFDGSKSGSIVAYEYDMNEKGPWGSFYHQFNFQIQQPVCMAQFSLELPEGWSYQAALGNCENCAYQEVEKRHVWTVRNLAYRQEEPLAPDWNHASRYISVNCFGPSENPAVCFADWQAAAAWGSAIVDSSMSTDPSLTDFTLGLTKEKGFAIEKVAGIADFVRSQIRYVAVEIGKGRFMPRPASATFTNRYGDCKDKSTLMRAMLKVAGVPSVAVLASVEEPLDSTVTSPFQFDHCIVGIPKNAFGPTDSLPYATVGDWVLYDPTDVTARFGHLPLAAYGAHVLTLTGSTPGLIQLPQLPPSEDRRVYRADAELKDDGSIHADVTIVDYGSMADETSHTWETTPERKQLDELRERLAPFLTNVTVSEYTTHTYGDSVIAHFQLSASNCLLRTGDMSLLKADFLHEDVKPTLKAKERTLPVYFGPSMSGETNITWRIGSAWNIAELQPPVYDSCRAGTIACTITAADSVITYHSRQILTGQPLAPSEYDRARNFELSMKSTRGMRIMLHPNVRGNDK